MQLLSTHNRLGFLFQRSKNSVRKVFDLDANADAAQAFSYLFTFAESLAVLSGRNPNHEMSIVHSVRSFS